DAQKLKRQSLLDVFHGIEHPDLTFAHDGSTFHPSGVDVGDIERVNELARSRVSRMRDQIGFGKAWGVNVPGIGFDGDMVFEQGAGFGAPVESFFELALFGLEPAVDGGGTDRQKLLLCLGRERQALDGPGQTEGYKGLEAGRARISS